jgi:hypothetical protein
VVAWLLVRGTPIRRGVRAGVGSRVLYIGDKSAPDLCSYCSLIPIFGENFS